MSAFLPRYVLILFCLVLMLAPLPFGSNRMWSAALLSALMGVLLFLTGLHLWRRGPSPALQFSPALKISFFLFALVMLWAFAQMTGLTPASWHHPLWAETGAILANSGFKDVFVYGAVALDPAASSLAMLRLLGYAACFIIAYIYATERDNAHFILRMLVAIALLYALYGLAVDAMGLKQVLWYPKLSYTENLTSTFINRNSYATFAALGLICCAAFVARRWLRTYESAQGRFFWQEFLQRFMARDLYLVILPIVVFAALVLSESRAGFVSGMVGLFVFGIALAINRRMRLWKLGFVLVIVAAGLFGLFVVGGTGLQARLDAHVVADDIPDRLRVYELTTNAIQDNPVFGYGLGNFDSVFRFYRDTSVRGWFHKAHNDYLETVLDLGIPAAALLWTALLLIILRCVHGVWIRRRDGIFPALGLAATAIVAAHSLVDFSLQIPAVTATYATLLGIAAAQSQSSRQSSSPHD